MAFELRLTFFGLTGLVPNKKVGTPGDPPEWLVVMPALANGAVLRFKKDQLPAPPLKVEEIPIAPHQAVLVVNAQAVKEGTTKEARLRFRDPRTPIPSEDIDDPNETDLPALTDAESDLLFQLDREAIEIDGPPNPTGVKVHRSEDGKTLKLPDVNNADQLHDLKWLPQIDDCLPHLPGGVPFDQNLFDRDTLLPTTTTTDRPVPLAAVVRLDRGILETSNVHRKAIDDQPATYEFRSLSGAMKFEQALAESFRLRVTMEEETATLVLTNKDEDPQSLVVGPYKGCLEEDGLRVVEVKVYNRELEEILGLGSDFMQQQGAADLDFLIFYFLSPVWSKLNAADLVAPRLGGSGGGGRSKPCEPPTYPGLS